MTNKRKGGPVKRGGRSQNRQNRPADPRRAALDVLSGLETAPAGTLADRLSAAVASMEARDKGFVRALVLETLRRHGQIDQIMTRCLTKGKPASVKLGWILKLGICQLLFLDTAAHAAVDRTVGLLRGPKEKPMAGLVNAVLRRVGRDGAAWVADQDAARLNTPDGLWTAWVAAHGEATARAIAEAHLQQAPLDISVKSNPEQWAERLGAEVLPTGSLRLNHSGDVTKLDGYAAGDWWVQDAAAALPVTLAGAVAGKRVVDLCAAPGGKALQLAAAGAKVTAVDSSKHRMERLVENFSRCGLGVGTAVADATDWKPSEPVDLVLLDAPCSATGTLRRHPDLPLIKEDTGTEALMEIQARLLYAAWAMLKPGGMLIYCTCSLDPREGEDRIRAFLSDVAAAELIPVTADEVGGLDQLVTDRGELRCLPSHLAEQGGMDGFYAARLVKNG